MEDAGDWNYEENSHGCEPSDVSGQLYAATESAAPIGSKRNEMDVEKCHHLTTLHIELLCEHFLLFFCKSFSVTFFAEIL